jgi:hypothetical protein
VLYLLSIVESTEPKKVYGVKIDFVSERTIKDHHHLTNKLSFYGSMNWPIPILRTPHAINISDLNSISTLRFLIING